MLLGKTKEIARWIILAAILVFILMYVSRALWKTFWL
jgi:hypothetical protein